MANMKLKRLKIDQYRNVAPGTELVFNDTWNVLLGQNGTGKTTLLNLIAMVVASDFSPLKEEAFAIEYDLSFTGGSSIAVHLQNTRQESKARPPQSAPEGVIDTTSDMIQPKADFLLWLCRVTIRLEGSPSSWEVSSSPRAATKVILGNASSNKAIPIINPFENRFIEAVLELFRWEDFSTTLANEWGLVMRAQRIAGLNIVRFDEGLTVFSAITGIQPVNNHGRARASGITAESVFVTSHNVQHYASSHVGIVPFGIVKLVMNDIFESSPWQKHAADAEEISFMERTATVLGFSHVELTWDLLQKEVGQKTERYTVGNFGFELTLDDGSIINHALLSYGQKRLLAFFYYLAANPDIAIADELVNGLHYDWIEVCLKEIGDRQSFLTSQNPLLLDFIPFTSAEDVQRSFLLCGREKRDGRNLMVWSNLDEESARSFFRAYETEAQQVSEILRSKGLW